MAFQSNIISLDGTKVPENRFSLPQAARGSVAECRRVLERVLPLLLEGMFENLDDALYALADKADSNRLQSAYFDALRDIRKGRAQMEQRFNGTLLACYDRFWEQGPDSAIPLAGEKELDADSLSLVEERDLEETLAVGNMVSRGENRHYKALYALNQRFGHLLEGMEVALEKNPVSPAVICNAFNSAIHGFDLEITVKLVVYKQFERRVVDQLGDLYGELNELLARNGVLPKLVRRVRRPSSPGKTSGGQTLPGEQPEGGEPGYGAGDIQTEVFSTLQQLLGQRRTRTPQAGHPHQEQLPVADASEMITALTTLQQGDTALATPQPVAGLGGDDMRAALMQLMQNGVAGGEARKISRNDEDAIDVISMLFEFILEDRNLPDAMKALLGRLQIPMLKVAILDKSFFSKKQHPARHLLNSLAKAGIGWSEGRGREEGGLYAKIESIVEQVVTGFENDLELFGRLDAELARFLEEEEKGSRITEQRATQVTQGKEQLQVARQRVVHEINERLFDHQEIPGVVVSLLKEGWKDVLLIIHLRQGVDSMEWRNALHLMDRLIWSVQPKEERRERQQLLKEMPLLLKGLRSGLNDISYDQHRMARLFQALHDCHIGCLKGTLPVTGTGSGSPLNSGTEEPSAPTVTREEGNDRGGDAVNSTKKTARSGVVSPAVRQPDVPHDRYWELAEQLPVGSWLEVAEEDGSRTRAKLSWRSQVTGNCLFVNRKGMKVAEIPLSGLATWFRSGRATLLEEVDVPLMDRALTAMVKTLKEKGEARQH